METIKLSSDQLHLHLQNYAVVIIPAASWIKSRMKVALQIEGNTNKLSARVINTQNKSVIWFKDNPMILNMAAQKDYTTFFNEKKRVFQYMSSSQIEQLYVTLVHIKILTDEKDNTLHIYETPRIRPGNP